MLYDMDASESDYGQPDKEVTSSDNGYNIGVAKLPC